MAERHFVKYTFLKVDPAWRRLDEEQRAQRQARVPRRLRGLRRRAPAAGLHARRDPRRRRPDAVDGDRAPRPHPRVPRRARAERAHEVVLAALLVPRHAQGLGVLRRAALRAAPVPRPLPVRLPVREAPRVVRARPGRALARDAGAHQGRQGVPDGRQPHDLLLRARRPGVRRRLRHRRRRRVPGPRAAPAHDRVLGLDRARHAELHLPAHVGRARARRARRRAGAGRAGARRPRLRGMPRPGAGTRTPVGWDPRRGARPPARRRPGDGAS